MPLVQVQKKSVVENTNSNENSTDWRSIYIASILSFVGSAQFSIYFSSLWPYLQILDRNATESYFGFIIAIYSLGQIISAPLFGYWSNRIKQVKVPLFVGLALMFIGNVFYIVLEMVGFPKYMMLIGRFITGMGSGNVANLRSYASTASTVHDRPKAIALVTCGQAIGNTAGPAFQLLFTPLGYPGFQLIPRMSLDMYTAPAYFACTMNFLGAIALHFLFKENYAGIIKKESGDKAQQKLPSYDLIAIFICYVTRFTQMFVNTNLETLGSPFAMTMFNWPENTAVTYTSIAQGLLGVVTLLTYIIYICTKAEKYMNHFRIGSIIALVTFFLFHAITFSWPFLPGHVFLRDIPATSTLPEKNIGCNMQKYSWCLSLNQVNVWVYYVAYVICIGVAYPSINITLSTLFSRILGPRLQGTQQGILQMAGSVARMVGPILISTLYASYGPRMAWILEAVVILCTFLLWIVFYRRMIPLRIPFLTIGSIESASAKSSVSSSISTISYNIDSEKKKLGMSMSLPNPTEKNNKHSKIKHVQSLYAPPVYYE